MLVSIRDCRHSKKDRQWIQDVYPEYLDALADLNTGLFSVLGASNPHQDEIFANWFANDHSHPLVISKGPEAVGFALVTRPRVAAAGEAAVNYHMSEFFIRKAYRRAGIGRDAAKLIFDRFRGRLGDRRVQRNPDSVAFWRRVLTALLQRPLHRAHPERRSAPALHQPIRRNSLNLIRVYRALTGSRARVDAGAQVSHARGRLKGKRSYGWQLTP